MAQVKASILKEISKANQEKSLKMSNKEKKCLMS